ncbi:transposase, partial [Thermoanaerobacter ethanolicus JW 200]
MLKIVHPICCGIDVHKKFLVAAIAITDSNNVTTYVKRRFSTFNSDLIKLRDWLLSYNCFEVCMESTGKYWIPIFNVLENPVMLLLLILSISVPLKDKKPMIRMLPGLPIYLNSISSLLVSSLLRISACYVNLFAIVLNLLDIVPVKKNRLQNAPTVSNIALASVVSDSFGKSASSIIEYILTCDTFDPEYCKSLLHKSLYKKADEVIQSIIGYELRVDQS